MAKAKTKTTRRKPTRRRRTVASGAVSRMSDEKRFEAQSDLRTLQEAERIKASRSRMAAAGRIANEEMAALRKVQRSTKK